MTKPMDVKQVRHALHRCVDRLQAEADRLGQDLDYTSQYYAEDAERLREALQLIARLPQHLPPVPTRSEEDLRRAIGILEEWAKGCTIAGPRSPKQDSDPAECRQCTDDAWLALARLFAMGAARELEAERASVVKVTVGNRTQDGAPQG